MRGHDCPQNAGHLLERAVIRGVEGEIYSPPLFRTVVDDLFPGNLSVGHGDHLVVHRAQLSIGQPDLHHRTGDAAGLHVVPRLEGLGEQHLDAAGQVGQSALDGQRHRQSNDAEHRHQASHGHSHVVQNDTQGNHPQNNPQGRMDEGMQAPLQLQAEESPVGQPENQLHDHKAACQKEQQGDELLQIQPFQKVGHRL